MEVVTERLLHSERKQKDKSSIDFSEKAMAAKFKGRSLTVRCCLERAKDEGSGNTKKEEVLLTSHVLGVSKPAQHWIVATCHICNFKELFEDFNCVQQPQQVR